MKKEGHPAYQKVLFEDTSCGDFFLINSTLTSNKTLKWEDGNTYPHVKIEVSSKSHPFYTGSDRIVDTEGRVEKFKKKFKL